MTDLSRALDRWQEEVDVESGPLRRLAVMGTMALMAMLVMYLFMAKTVTDTDVPRIRSFVATVLDRSLVPESETTLKLRRLAPGLDAPRHYELVFTPREEITDDPRALDKLLTRAAGHVVQEIGKKRGAISVTCVARLPDGSEERRTFDARLQPTEEPAAPPSTEE